MRRKTFTLTAATLFGLPLAAATAAAVVLFGVPSPARAQHHDPGQERVESSGCGCGHSPPATAAMEPPAGAPGAQAGTSAPARTVELAVTADGFVPAEVRVKKGEPLRLAITRKVERTCATEIVVKDYGIDRPLPLGKTVYVDFTPTRSGSVRYACAMNMIGGVLIVD